MTRSHHELTPRTPIPDESWTHVQNNIISVSKNCQYMTNQVLHIFRLVSRGHTGICNLHALSSEKEKKSKLLAKPFCRRHASSIPARSTQEEKPDQLDQEKVHRWESSRNTKYDAFLHFLATP